tara:strand:+ start:38 stop:1942 length:1905 start_codon:yes stop_codon:yes gene_type:complete
MAYSDKYLNSYDRIIADVEAGSDRNVQPQLVPDEGTFRGNIEQGVASTLGLFGGTERRNLQQAQKLTGLGDYLPGTGTALAAADFEDARQAGDGTGMLLSGIGAFPFVGKPARALGESAGNVINQLATNMPTRIEGFYSGNPIGSFARDAAYEVGGALKSRMSAADRAFQDVWGTSAKKVEDMFNRGGPAQRLREKGRPQEAVGYGDDAEKTALAIEAQQGTGIIPVNERGALANGIHGLSYYDRGIGAEDTARLGRGIGNGFRNVDDIPDNITDKAVNHLINGPHVKSGSGNLYEYQVKTLESSKQAGVKEGAGAGRGSPLLRAFNVKDPEGKATSPFLAYNNFLNKTVNKTKGEIVPPSPKDTVEFTQLAATLDKDATKVLNSLLPRKKKDGQLIGSKQGHPTKTLLDRLSKARARQRAGLPIPAEQQDVLDAFNKGVKNGKIKPKTIKDEQGNIVSSLNYDEIKTPEGFITAQQSYASAQKELGGVNQLLIVDPYNQVNYSMVSDGHDIFGMAPVGGHHLITAQPIVRQKWSDRGYDPKEHKTMMTRENVSKAVEETQARTGVKAPKKTLEASNANYVESARRYTKQTLKEAIEPTAAQKRAAQASTTKLVGAGGVAVGTGGMLLSGEEEE